jgi:hypothetical protein
MGDQSSAKRRKPVEIRVMQMDAVRNFTYLEGLGSHRWCAVHGVFHKLKGNFTPELLATAPERRYCKAFADEAACVAHFERNGGTWSTDISLAQLRFFMEDSKYTRTNVPGLNIEMDVLEEQHPEGSYRYVRQDGQKDAIIRVSGIVSDRGQVMYDHVIIDGQTKALAVSHYKFFELIVDHDLVISELRSGVESQARRPAERHSHALRVLRAGASFRSKGRRNYRLAKRCDGHQLCHHEDSGTDQLDLQRQDGRTNHRGGHGSLAVEVGQSFGAPVRLY